MIHSLIYFHLWYIYSSCARFIQLFSHDWLFPFKYDSYKRWNGRQLIRLSALPSAAGLHESLWEFLRKKKRKKKRERQESPVAGQEARRSEATPRASGPQTKGDLGDLNDAEKYRMGGGGGWKLGWFHILWRVWESCQFSFSFFFSFFNRMPRFPRFPRWVVFSFSFLLFSVLVLRDRAKFSSSSSIIIIAIRMFCTMNRHSPHLQHTVILLALLPRTQTSRRVGEWRLLEHTCDFLESPDYVIDFADQWPFLILCYCIQAGFCWNACTGLLAAPPCFLFWILLLL